jgi:Arc/MetJ-type ribon-helix-helix transcriptional regulator
MPFHMVKVAPEFYDFVGARVESGRYENAGQLMEAAFRALHREERIAERERATHSIAEADVFRKLWEVSADSSSIRR